MMRTELARSFRISSTSVGRLMSAPNMKTETAIDKTVSKVLRRLRDRLRSTSGNRFITSKSLLLRKMRTQGVRFSYLLHWRNLDGLPSHQTSRAQAWRYRRGGGS